MRDPSRGLPALAGSSCFFYCSTLLASIGVFQLAPFTCDRLVAGVLGSGRPHPSRLRAQNRQLQRCARIADSNLVWLPLGRHFDDAGPVGQNDERLAFRENLLDGAGKLHPLPIGFQRRGSRRNGLLHHSSAPDHGPRIGRAASNDRGPGGRRSGGREGDARKTSPAA